MLVTVLTVRLVPSARGVSYRQAERFLTRLARPALLPRVLPVETFLALAAFFGLGFVLRAVAPPALLTLTFAFIVPPLAVILVTATLVTALA